MWTKRRKIMPKVKISDAKGLVQSAGAGFSVSSSASVSAAGALDATTFLTVATGAVAGGGLVLPASAETGAIKIIIADTADNVLVKGTNATTGDITLTNIGDMCICVFNGTEWVVGRSLT